MQKAATADRPDRTHDDAGKAYSLDQGIYGSPPTFVVGTAGHVDHGKSTLVRALTGTDPDRLAEEQERQMTIDLGFAELETPAGNRVHIVDVPGHERFIRNMLAGAGGVDAAILVIAADDGPMPQTREHLAILELLGIGRGVVALSKADLVDDDWLDLISESIRELLAQSPLAGSEIVPVSSPGGVGLLEIQAALDQVLQTVDRSTESGRPRLPIDRIFTMPGFGTVVTGTLLGGPLRLGDEVEIFPTGLHGRIRGLQTFGRTADLANPGSRVAVNLAGIGTDELRRGNVLAKPGQIVPVMRFDAHFRVLAGSSCPLEHNDDVVVYLGSAEVAGKAALLDAEQIGPGEEGWVQLRLSTPIAAVLQERFVVRRPSPPETVGGGIVVALDSPRHRRFRSEVIENLVRLSAGDPLDRFVASIGDRVIKAGEVRSQLEPELVEQIERDERLVWIGPEHGRMLARGPAVEAAIARMVARVDRFHLDYPLEPGMIRESLRQDLGFERHAFDALLWQAAEGAEIEDLRTIVRRPGFTIVLGADQQEKVDRYLSAIDSAGFQPPTPAEWGLDQELIMALVATNRLVALGDGIAFSPERLEEARALLIEALSRSPEIVLAEFRDLLGTTRRYAQALLEYFDQQRVTRRVGDRRVAVRPVRSEEGAH